MNPKIYRVIFLVIALALTVGVFSLWGEFGRALGAYMAVAYKDEPPKPTGVVTMKIVPPTPLLVNRPACDKKHPCPKP
ncbi:MAG TPA: hypothetical protein VGH02_04485 [Rhizomicrobium sp.]|jgi:hypothetical protein